VHHKVPKRSNASSSCEQHVLANLVGNSSSPRRQHILASAVAPDELIKAHASVERTVALLEDRDQQILTGAEMMHLENRIAVLEATEKRRRSEAVYASRSAARMPEESQKCIETKKKAYGDPRVLELVVKTQYLDDAIADLQTKLEKQAIRLEAIVRHQEMQLCKALDERCEVIEERLGETLMAQSRRILDSMHEQRPANLAGPSDVSNVAQSTSLKCSSNAPLKGIVCDNDKEPHITEDAIECETTKTLVGSAVPSYASSEPAPTPRETSVFSFSADESIAVWHPFSDRQPGNVELRPNHENTRQSRHIPGHLRHPTVGNTKKYTRV